MTTKQVLVGRGLCLNCTRPLTLRHERESHYCSPCEVDRLRERVRALENELSSEIGVLIKRTHQRDELRERCEALEVLLREGVLLSSRRA